MGQGILTPAQEQQLATMIDALLNLKGIANIVAGYALKIVISLIDNSVIDKLSTAIKAQLIAIVDAILGGNNAQAEKLSGELVNSLDAYKTDTSEKLAFKTGVLFALAATTQHLNLMKGSEVTLKLKK